MDLEGWIPWEVTRAMDTGQKEWPIRVSAMFVDVMIAYTCPLFSERHLLKHFRRSGFASI